MDVPFALLPRGRGNVVAPLSINYLRDLGAADVQATQENQGWTAPPITKLRDRHHALARQLANGMSDIEAGIVTGYTPGRISILRKDPSFQDLIKFYQNERVEAFRDVQQRMASLALDAVDEIHSRLEEKPEEFTTSELLDVTKVMADRSGAGPTIKKETNVNVNIGLADRLRSARERVAQDRASAVAKLIEGTVIDGD
jgi:flagellar biosynthesis/type III secretory pathway protein FliH